MMKKLLLILFCLPIFFGCGKDGLIEETSNDGSKCFNTYRNGELIHSICYEYESTDKSSVEKWDENGYKYYTEKYRSGILTGKWTHKWEHTDGETRDGWQTPIDEGFNGWLVDIGLVNLQKNYNTFVTEIYSPTTGNAVFKKWVKDGCIIYFEKYWDNGTLYKKGARNNNCNLDGVVRLFNRSGFLTCHAEFNDGNLIDEYCTTDICGDLHIRAPWPEFFPSSGNTYISGPMTP